ncbi:MAG: Hpt domain-containing protein [Actinomycetota bacterium]|nr:Hpt domain-containing protein [Actinomycetota bacterium]
MNEVRAALQALFEKHGDEFDRRIQTLEEAVSAVRAGALDDELRGEANRDAHKLVGSLGMFGLPRGSELARELEQALASPGGPPASEAPRLAELVVALRQEIEAPSAGPPRPAPQG